MTKTYKPGQNTGKDGGIYQEVGPRGGLKDNYSTVRDNQRLPPTTTPGNGWVRTNRTPDSKRQIQALCSQKTVSAVVCKAL